ncbi:MAG: YqiA/YcfP family alpha/beta fold hydrolase [Pseudanabaenaceae cyanobacterium bins.39]|nr:YqiA/YcfP family alpha/beta fold hydrolase [Pseudanabaenaceae cyanobacterium bins.39]
MKYLYLHGFASSPRSYKAQYMRQKFQEIGLELDVPDLNLADFATVTLSAQLEFLSQNYLSQNEPVTIIGSSLGGFLAVLLAAQQDLVTKLVLFAPAFGFSDRLVQKLGLEGIKLWQSQGSREFWHYGFNRNINLHYQFFSDAQKYSENNLTRSLPTLIFHGIYDDVIPFATSQEFSKERSQVILTPLEDDHALGKYPEMMWQQIQEFIG